MGVSAPFVDADLLALVGSAGSGAAPVPARRSRAIRAVAPVVQTIEQADLVVERDEIAYRRVRHSTRCDVCKHPERDEIEAAYLGWADPDQLALAYGVKSIEKHVLMFGLVGKRAQNVAAALGKLAQQGLTELKPGDVHFPRLMRTLDRLTKLLEKQVGLGEPADVPAPMALGPGVTWEEMVRVAEVRRSATTAGAPPPPASATATIEVDRSTERARREDPHVVTGPSHEKAGPSAEKPESQKQQGSQSLQA